MPKHKATTKWKTYEEVAKYLIDRFKSEFNLQSIEGKQLLVGKDSGTEWEIDAKGVAYKKEDFIIIEARRHTTSKHNQERIAGLAYRIKDTGAKGGILVSPLGLQKGGKKVAAANNIISVNIDANSTPERFSMEFFGRLFVGASVDRFNYKTHPATIRTGEDSQ